MNVIRETYKAGGVRGVLSAFREGWREGGGTREFLRCVRYDWMLYVGIGLGIVVQEFSLLVVMAMCAAIGASAREWTARAQKRIIEGYGTMVDEQQAMLHRYQNLNGQHQSERSAINRIAKFD